jgi:glycolate oxidase
MFDAAKEGEKDKAEACGANILKLCVEKGGCLTGEHGVGIEKRDLMPVQFSPEDLRQQMRVKAMFDPQWLLNPGKVFPLDQVASFRRAADTKVFGADG